MAAKKPVNTNLCPGCNKAAVIRGTGMCLGCFRSGMTNVKPKRVPVKWARMEPHVCRSCGRRDTSHPSQICGPCASRDWFTSRTDPRQDRSIDNRDDRRSTAYGPREDDE